jgi:hypothetical protein
MGDLSDMPADYRGHIVRAAASRAIRKNDFPMLEKCVATYKSRASTNLFCMISEEWKGEPQPVIALMLKHGARLNGHCEDRPLVSAAACGNVKMMTALLEMKADPALATGPAGTTALHIAARAGRFETVRLLLDHGLAADLPDRLGRTPLSFAEKGKEHHMSACDQGQGCERCEARIQVLGELRWRLKGQKPASIDHSSSDQPSSAPGGPSSTVENDAESEVSSSECDESSSEVSDMMSDWDSEEEDEGQEDDADIESMGTLEEEEGEEEEIES